MACKHYTCTMTHEDESVTENELVLNNFNGNLAAAQKELEKLLAPSKISNLKESGALTLEATRKLAEQMSAGVAQTVPAADDVVRIPNT